jgi:hypothetical protein
MGGDDVRRRLTTCTRTRHFHVGVMQRDGTMAGNLRHSQVALSKTQRNPDRQPMIEAVLLHAQEDRGLSTGR